MLNTDVHGHHIAKTQVPFVNISIVFQIHVDTRTLHV